PLGSTVHDHAIVTDSSGNPVTTGTVTFSYWAHPGDFSNNDPCSGDPTTTITVGYVAGAGFETPSTAALHAGSYAYAAIYNGGNGFAASSGDCEPLRVGQGALAMETSINGNGTTTVDLGSTVFDTAHFIPGPPYTPGFVPTGTVTYTFSGNDPSFPA